MPEFAPSVLSDWTGGVWRGPAPGPVTGFSIDSRSLQRGELFVAIRTSARDGHAFLGAALGAGTPAAIVSQYDPAHSVAQLVVPDPVVAFQLIARCHRDQFSLPVIAITGSSGKTSTKDLVGIALGGGDRALSTEGNLNNTLGVPLTLLRIDPDQHRFAVVEAGINRVGEMDDLARMIRPRMAVVSSLAAAHLDHLGSIEQVAREKSRLLKHLLPGGQAIFPADCLRWDAFRELSCETVLIGLEGPQGPDAADTDPRQITYRTRTSSSGSAIEAIFDSGQVISFTLASTSPGMASNAVLALAVADRCGVDLVAASRRLESWRPAALRGEVRMTSGRLVYVDCYNANPSSMIDAVQAFNLRVPAAEPRLFVVGCMDELGPSSGVLHSGVGRAWPLRSGDCFALIGDQTEDLRRGLIAAGQPAGSILIAADLEGLHSRVGAWTGAVFIKGSRRYRLESLLGALKLRGVGEEALC